jgi:hypothetical protein
MVFRRAARIFLEEMRKAKGAVVDMHRTIEELDARALAVLAVFFRDR